MIPSLSGVFGSATAQDNPFPTSTQINYDLACTCCLHNIPRPISGTRRDALSMATDSDSIVKPNSEEKLRCVKCGLRTKFCAQNRTPSTSSSFCSLMATRSGLTKSFFASGSRNTDHKCC